MGKRLLVVDSDRRFIQDHKSPLESAFEVDFLYATEGALTRLESGQYGALLLCVETSENKGYALCSAIRRAPDLGDLKIALISAKATEEEYSRHRGTKGKADLYLHKPINSSALIPALAAYVPMREDDPDNPLGDLAGADLGDEWLESLKTELDTEPVRAVQPPQVIAPAPGWATEASTERASRNQGEVELLEWRVKDLELKLAARYEELERKNHDIEELIQRNAAVTRNLDEVQQTQSDVDLLRQRVLDREAAFGRLQDELQDALDEQKHLIDQLEDVNTLLAEKTQQNAELLESHQLLQAQLEEAWEAGSQVKALEGSLAEAQSAARDLEARAGAAEHSRTTLQQDLEAAEHSRTALQQDLAAAASELAERMVRIQELEGTLGRIPELEAELASAKDQVSFQELSIHNLAEERAGLQADRERQDDALTEQAGEMIVLQEKLALLEAAAQDAKADRERLAELRAQMESTVAGLEKQLESTEAAHEAQRRELMAGIAEREANLGRLTGSLDGQREQIAQLERDKTDLAAQLQGRHDRLETITAVLTELEGKARQALDLAKTVPH